MTIESSLSTWVATNITLAVGGVHARDLPQNPVLPALTYIRVSTVPTHSHEGNSNLTECRFQFDCWAATYIQARALAKQLVDLLDGYAGIMGDVYIGHCLYSGDRDLHDPAVKRDHPPIEFMIAFNE